MKNLFKDCKTVSDCEEKLNKLIDSWPVVYNEERATAWTCISSPLDTHQARLAFIEPIEEESCKHEPREWLLLGAPKTLQPVCIHCGAKLKATWSEK